MNALAPQRPTVETTPREDFSLEYLAVYLLAAVPILIKLLCYPTYPGSDDAFIHLTMVRNLTHGAGWGINPGEPVYLSSSPLYTLLLAGINLCKVPALFGGECLSAIAGFLSLVFLHRLLGRLGVGRAFRLAGVFIAAFNIFLWRWNGVVMETTTTLFLLTLACWLYHGTNPAATDQAAPAWRYALTGIIVGLATLTRFETALILGCFGLCEMANRRPSRWLPSCLLLSLGFFVVMVPWLTFCHFYFHDLLPTTYYKKVTNTLLLWNPAVAVSLAKLVVSSDAFPLLGSFVLLILALGQRKQLAIRQTVIPQLDIFLFPLLLALFYYTKMPAPESTARYYLPGLHLFAVVLACLLESSSRDVPLPRLRVAMAGLLTAQAVLALALNQFQVAPILSRFRENYMSTAQGAAGYLKTQAAAGRKINVLVEIDIGMISYFLDNACYLIDGGALATPALRNKTLVQQLAETHPDFVVETLGDRIGGMNENVPSLRLVWHRPFLSHSLSNPRSYFVTNIYENQKP